MANSLNNKAVGDLHANADPVETTPDWANTLKALQLAQTQYATAKKQVDELHRTFAEIEARASHDLRNFISQCETLSGSPAGIMGKPASKSGRAIKNTSPLTALRVYCLGGFQLFLNGEKVEHWHSQKARSLLKYMLTRHKKAVSRSEGVV